MLVILLIQNKTNGKLFEESQPLRVPSFAEQAELELSSPLSWYYFKS